MVRNDALWPNDLLDRFAWIGRNLASHYILILARTNHRLGQINRISDDRHERHPIRMPDEMLRYCRAIAARNSVAANPAFFQVRCVDRQNVAFPFPRRKPLCCVKSEVRRMWTTIHPDRALCSPCEM